MTTLQEIDDDLTAARRKGLTDYDLIAYALIRLEDRLMQLETVVEDGCERIALAIEGKRKG
jgi:hypothetical protein